MSGSAVYRSQARRLRKQFASEPAVLQFRLCELARRQDQVYAQPAPQPAERDYGQRPVRIQAVPCDPAQDTPFARAVVDWFAAQVTEQLSGGLLHQSRRRELLRTAERLGIGRFHANLIIAVAQNSAQARPSTSYRLEPAKSRIPYAATVLILIVQTAIIWGAFHVLHAS